MSEATTFDDLIRLTGRRSVYSQEQLQHILEQSPEPVRVIDFLLGGHLSRPLDLKELLRARIFNRHPPQTICRISDDKFQIVRDRLSLGFKV